MTTQPHTTAAIAVLGTGIMGAPMARNLVGAGFEVRAWNRTREKAEPLAADGVRIADDPEEAVRGAGFVLTMLADADTVLEVMEAAAAGAAEGTPWLQTSTVGIEGTERCAALAGERGLVLVDAPVLGTKQPAEQAQLLVLASGPDEVRERCAPVFDAIGRGTMWVGEAGTGTRLKLVTNAWVLAVVEALGETVALAEALDLDPALFLEAIGGGPLDSDYAQLKGNAMIQREFAAAFPLKLAAKDAALVVQAAERHQLDLPLPRTIAERMARGAEEHGDEDMAATVLTSLP